MYTHISMYTLMLVHPQVNVCIDAYTHTRYLYTHRCLYTHKYMHTYIHWYTHACTHTSTSTHRCKYTQRDACTHTDVCTHISTSTHTDIYIHTKMLIHTQVHVHTHICLYTHKYIYTQRCIYTHRCMYTHTLLCGLVSYLNDTKPQPTKGIINRHRIIFQFLVSREISPYHCLERKFWRKQTKEQVLISAMTCQMVCDLPSQPSNLPSLSELRSLFFSIGYLDSKGL